MKLLIVEDEKGMADSITRFLQTEDFICETAADFEAATDKIQFYTYECILLDITLPDGNGLNILRQLKKAKRKEGIIIISARGSLDDKIEGLTIGADDYLSKPFHLAELSARVKAVIRRKYFESNNEINIGHLHIDINGKKATCHDKLLDLTKSEFELLAFLVSNKNKVISKKAIAENISGDKADYFDSYDFIYSHLKNLKKKLAAAGYADSIKSVYGLGYKLEL